MSDVHAQHRKLRPQYPLPASARVIVDGPFNDIPQESGYRSACDGFRTSPQQIRRWFRVDAQIDGRERHDGIDEVACGIDGRILLGGKTFSWRLVQAEAGFIETDFPDGVNKLLAHTVGDLSDSPREHKLSKYVDPRYWNN